MAETIGQHQQGAFTTPVNGTTADASVVLSNDNTLRSSYNDHDNDPGLHVQSSVLGSRPAASSAGRKWLTTDGLRLYYDTGAAWSEVAYLPSVGGTVSGNVTVSAGGITVTGNSTITGTLGGVTTLTATTVAGTLSTAAQPNITSVGTLTSLGVGAITSTGLFQTTLTTQQLSLRYDTSNHLAVTVASNGAVTYNATGAGATHNFSDTVTISGGTLTLNAAGTNDINFKDSGDDKWSFGLNVGGVSSGELVFYDRVVTASVMAYLVAGAGLAIGPYGAALATSATKGFLYIPTCAGTPTGTPAGGAAMVGKVAFVFDTTNNKLYVYDGGWLATAALT